MQNPKQRKIWRWLLLIPLAVIVIVVGALILWLVTPARAMPQAEPYLTSSDTVEVVSGNGLVFRPKGVNPDTGLIFYSGGRVVPDAYAPLAYRIAEAGYLVVLPNLPFNLAALNIDAASEVIARYPDVEHWAVGGHSLGGSMAAQYVLDHPDSVEALVLWAAYPADSTDLSHSDLSVLMVYGSLDEGRDSMIASQSLLPEDSIFVEIEGGNHEQFGWYGDQLGDPDATITREEQQQTIIEATIQLLSSLQNNQ